MRPLLARWLGRVPYADGLALQAELVRARRRDAVPDCLLLLEHPPVVTLGRGARPEHVRADRAELARRGVELHECGRGGDVTYHGPGQLVGYPILSLPPGRRDAHRFLRDLEESLIRAVASFGIVGGRIAGRTGVWVGDEKLAALGVRLSTGWISSHGFALNVGPDLAGFSLIVPCGIAGCRVTSLARLLGSEPELRTVAARVARELAGVFALRLATPVADDERLDRPVPRDAAEPRRQPAGIRG
jgi:lipoyl(octanoyl) transferase